MLTEDLSEQLDDEVDGRALVIVKDELNRRGNGGKLVHENPQGTTTECLEQKKNISNGDARQAASTVNFSRQLPAVAGRRIGGSLPATLTWAAPSAS